MFTVSGYVMAAAARKCLQNPDSRLAGMVVATLLVGQVGAFPGFAELPDLLPLLVQSEAGSAQETNNKESGPKAAVCGAEGILSSAPQIIAEAVGFPEHGRIGHCSTDPDFEWKSRNVPVADSNPETSATSVNADPLDKVTNGPVAYENASRIADFSRTSGTGRELHDRNEDRGSSVQPANSGVSSQNFSVSGTAEFAAGHTSLGHPVSGNVSAEAKAFANLGSDPLTEARSRLLKESGLLERQSEISESILLMERQVRQAELIEKLMERLGPDTPIEIAPGRFRVFRDTPAGQRIAAEMAERRMQIRMRLINLEREIFEAQSRFRRKSEDTPEAAIAVPGKVAIVPAIGLLEIYGSGNDLTAVVQFGDERLHVDSGSELPNGTRVVSVGTGSIVTELAGRRRVYQLGR